MKRKKNKVEIPSELAARVLFLADRTCCVCRNSSKPIQIHHIDNDANNNSLPNLAVLCFDCHRNTQIKGGFDRKLDADQVILYRDDWNRIVARTRAEYEAAEVTWQEDKLRTELVTSVAEIFRENEEFELLAMHYNSIGNKELRDKYIELAIENNPSDQTICYLRTLQDKPDLIPTEVIEREIQRYIKNRDWLQRARFYLGLNRYQESAIDYVRGIGESLRKNEIFSAAYYLKELAKSEINQELFILAYKQAQEEGDLWWQVRALEELEWQKELDDLILRNAEEIEKTGDSFLLLLLAKAKGEKEKVLELQKDMARYTHITIMGEEDDT